MDSTINQASRGALENVRRHQKSPCPQDARSHVDLDDFLRAATDLAMIVRGLYPEIDLSLASADEYTRNPPRRFTRYPAADESVAKALECDLFNTWGGEYTSLSITVYDKPRFAVGLEHLRSEPRILSYNMRVGEQQEYEALQERFENPIEGFVTIPTTAHEGFGHG